MGSYMCICNDGWSKVGNMCTNDNECDLMTAACHMNATCKDTIGSYICQCNEGFNGSGVLCKGIVDIELFSTLLAASHSETYMYFIIYIKSLIITL